MSKRKDSAVLQDIRAAIARISSYATGLECDDFVTDFKTQDAIIRNIEILGKAVKLLSEETKTHYPKIPRKDIAETRDSLIHDSFDVNIDAAWSIAKNDIPLLHKKIEKKVC